MLRLTVLLKTVRSWMLNDCWARCNSPPASSRSEFEIVSLGLADVTSLLGMYFGHSRRHTGVLFLSSSLGGGFFPGCPNSW